MKSKVKDKNINKLINKRKHLKNAFDCSSLIRNSDQILYSKHRSRNIRVLPRKSLQNNKRTTIYSGHNEFTAKNMISSEYNLKNKIKKTDFINKNDNAKPKESDLKGIHKFPISKISKLKIKKMKIKKDTTIASEKNINIKKLSYMGSARSVNSTGKETKKRKLLKFSKVSKFQGQRFVSKYKQKEKNNLEINKVKSFKTTPKKIFNTNKNSTHITTKTTNNSIYSENIKVNSSSESSSDSVQLQEIKVTKEPGFIIPKIFKLEDLKKRKSEEKPKIKEKIWTQTKSSTNAILNKKKHKKFTTSLLSNTKNRCFEYAQDFYYKWDVRKFHNFSNEINLNKILSNMESKYSFFVICS